MSALLSLDMQSDSWRRAGLNGRVSCFIPHMFVTLAASSVAQQGGILCQWSSYSQVHARDASELKQTLTNWLNRMNLLSSLL